jgi:hypothetical protein
LTIPLLVGTMAMFEVTARSSALSVQLVVATTVQEAETREKSAP